MQKRGEGCDAQTERVGSTFQSHSETDGTAETHNSKHQSSSWLNPPVPTEDGRQVAGETDVTRTPARDALPKRSQKEAAGLVHLR